MNYPLLSLEVLDVSDNYLRSFPTECLFPMTQKGRQVLVTLCAQPAARAPVRPRAAPEPAAALAAATGCIRPPCCWLLCAQAGKRGQAGGDWPMRAVPQCLHRPCWTLSLAFHPSLSCWRSALNDNYLADINAVLGNGNVANMATLHNLLLHNNMFIDQTIPDYLTDVPVLAQLTLSGTSLQGAVPAGLPPTISLCSLSDRADDATITGYVRTNRANYGVTNFTCPLPADLRGGACSTTLCQAPPGFSVDSFVGAALPCPPGTFKANWGTAPQCTLCSPGTVTVSPAVGGAGALYDGACGRTAWTAAVADRPRGAFRIPPTDCAETTDARSRVRPSQPPRAATVRRERSGWPQLATPLPNLESNSTSRPRACHASTQPTRTRRGQRAQPDLCSLTADDSRAIHVRHAARSAALDVGFFLPAPGLRQRRSASSQPRPQLCRVAPLVRQPSFGNARATPLAFPCRRSCISVPVGHTVTANKTAILECPAGTFSNSSGSQVTACQVRLPAP